MKVPRFATLAAALLLGSLVATAGAAAQTVPPPTLFPLNQIPVPEPPNLFQFVKSKPAAIKLGKAFFWDMQVGSDGVQACASCHFHAGADNRLKNTVNPGTRGGDSSFQVRRPNETLQPGDFPFHLRDNPDFESSTILRDFNDVVGSQGVQLHDFVGIVPGSAQDAGSAVADPVFQAGGVNTRRVTARNTPSNINAVFNFNNFWDGRAHFVFNGVNPFGPLDPSAGVWFNETAGLVKRPVAIPFASLASQATGPPLDDVEMSYRGRSFPDIAKKLLAPGLVPLGKQLVHPGDSVLGPLSRAVLLPNGTMSGSPGLAASYGQMIRDAFQDNLWNASQTTPEGFSQMQANFSLFWGLAIQLYEATLVSDQTPYDRFLGGDKTALTKQQQDGFNIFNGGGGCAGCHVSTETTDASVRASAFLTNSSHALVDVMVVRNGLQIIYDLGYQNTAVRPTGEDIGRGGSAPFTNALTGQPFPLSFTALAELQASGSLGFNSTLFPFGTPATPVLPAQVPASFPVANDGNFKVPGLRNIELTAPYFHNGGDLSLRDVIHFYTRGGNFPELNAASVDAAFQDIGSLVNNQTASDALVAFMNSMTDERVRNHAAPFDHPELFVPNGDPDFIKVAARDANGNIAPSLGVTIDPVSSPTNKASLVLSGTVDTGSNLALTVDTAASVGPVTLNGNVWSATVSGLVKGVNNVTASATDLSGNVATAHAAVTLVTLPSLTVNPVQSPTAATSQTLSGTVEPGVTPVLAVNTGATPGPVSVSPGGDWSCTVTGLIPGLNVVTVVAGNILGDLAVRTALISFAPGDGDASLDGKVDVADALAALRHAVGVAQLSSEQKLHADVAPLPTPDGQVDVADALLILRKVVGLASF